MQFNYRPRDWGKHETINLVFSWKSPECQSGLYKTSCFLEGAKEWKEVTQQWLTAVSGGQAIFYSVKPNHAFLNYNMEQAFCPFFFFFFCFGGCSTTFMAASKTPFTFWNYKTNPINGNGKTQCPWRTKKKKKRMCIPAVFSNYIQCRKELQ